ncbi:hypothetical protein CBP31_00945 [Oceanisphaera profunda]|uniref:DUF2254 domain-containing protein n=1 Tax=Oceanisphaera profunda TaxID=1416627 RepID=A0A1Y0D2Q6_9GAMM|nr:DUF2254 domain-containing protein [Oceanisphaera profunda]ART81375.1 hypothetical protein CBP31_00945 [Oceanisphaera profunda]
MIRNKIKFTIQNLQEKLWIKPLGYAFLAVLAVLVSHFADSLPNQNTVPDISIETIEKLLTVISASMLGVATFAVASMVSAYASAGGSATPRAFTLIISDGLSQTALSSFIGAFIFSIVGIIAIKIGYFAVAGRFVIFLLTISIFAWVVVTFVRWVDNIARLGRMGNTIEKVDTATREAFQLWPRSAPLGGQPVDKIPEGGIDLFSEQFGFIRQIDTGRLNQWAKDNDAFIYLQSLPGAFIHPQRKLLTVQSVSANTELDMSDLLGAFDLGDRRTFGNDPRFGLIAMSEIGSRALSPGINDPGTAIDIVIRMSRIIRDWNSSLPDDELIEPELERVFVTPLDVNDVLEDSYAAICRDGVGSAEVGIWIQKSLAWLVQTEDPDLRNAACKWANLSFKRAQQEITFEHDLERVSHAHEALVELSSARITTTR